MTELKMKCICAGFVIQDGYVVAIEDHDAYKQMVRIHTGQDVEIGLLVDDEEARAKAEELGFTFLYNKPGFVSLHDGSPNWKQKYDGQSKKGTAGRR